jgi:hypothetical protein
MEYINYNNEAENAIHALKRDNKFETAIEQILLDLNKVSTFDCFINGSPKNAADLIAELSISKSKDIKISDNVLYGLHLLSMSETRYEEFNNQELGLTAIRVLFDVKLARMGCSAHKSSLMETAFMVKAQRDSLPPHKIVFQNIDGSTRRHDELVMNRIRLHSLPDIKQWVEKELASKSERDFLPFVTDIVSDLQEKTNADFVLLTGPIRDLSSCNFPTTDDFFSYVFYNDVAKITKRTEFESAYEWAQQISNVFRTALKRYRYEGYQTLWPGIAINEDNRPEHQHIGIKSLIRGPGSLFGKDHQFDLRCGSLYSNGIFNTSKLNLLLDTTEVLSPVIENAIRNNFSIPMFNQVDNAESSHSNT